MPIEKTSEKRPGFWAGQTLFPSLRDAQKSELVALFTKEPSSNPNQESVLFADTVLKNADAVVAILTCAPAAKPPRKPRSDLGSRHVSRKGNGAGPAELPDLSSRPVTA